MLCLLPLSHDLHLWPATQPVVFAAIFLAVVFVPLVVIQAAGLIPSHRLAIWAAAAAVMAAIIGGHDMLRRAPQLVPRLPESIEAILPFPTGVFFAGGLFIAHALIVAACLDGRRIARYATYFDVAWKQCVQTVAAAGFTAVFWIVLHLGAKLFGLIKLDFLSRLIDHAWFAFPATAIAVTAAIHVTDVRPQIIRSIKTLMLTLLAWLLPLATLIAAGFLLSLPMTGLAPLWATKSATPILLGCAAGLVVLLNAAYQDGAPDRAVPVLLRAVGTAAAVLLFPMVAIAAYGVALRVGQYGWTKDRIIAAAGILVAAFYAAGYLWATRAWRGWLKPLETCNIVTSFVVLGVIAALFTPVADPARLAAASQIARLESGKVAPEQFDFMSLRFDNERYGYNAVRILAAQAAGPKAEVIKAEAGRALAAKFKQNPVAGLDAATLANGLNVSPPGARLPDSFLNQDWAKEPEARVLSQCLRGGSGPCTAVLLDVDGDGAQEIAVVDGKGYGPATVFGEFAGAWRDVGQIMNLAGCADTRESLAQGHFEMVAPAWREVVVGTRRLPVIPKGAPCTP
ncbi:MAG: DUF4153 domain-containing protein [Rhodospirillaceae bacterium]